MEEDLLDIPQFRKHLREMQQAFKEGMIEEEEYPAEMEDLVAAMGRLEKELANQSSQQLLADFFMVYTFLQAYDEDAEEQDDDDEEFDDEEYEEDEEEEEDN